MLSILLLDKDMAAVWTDKGTNFEVVFILVESKSANLAQKLSTAAGIVIEVVVGCTAAMAYSIGRHGIAATGLDWLKILAVIKFVFIKQNCVIQPFRLLDDRELIDSELVVFRACNIVFWRLERYIFHYEQKQLLDL
nr:hypothetical protein [Acetivibrio straminisolvens]